MGFLASVCTAAIAAALFRLLVPENKAAGQISLLIVCVFLLTALSSLGNIDINLDSDTFDVGATEEYIGFSGEVNKSLQKKICSDMSEKVNGILHENGYFPQRVHIIVNISGLYSIDIEQVRLVFSEKDSNKAAAAAALVQQRLGDGIKVTYETKE